LLELPRLGSGRRGAGERAAISLSLELRADALFIDDRKGIQEAQRLGIRTARMLSLVDRAAELGLIDDLPSALHHLLHSTPFFAGQEVLRVVDDLLRRDEERRQRRPPPTTA
jgi:predicted nucleic acid-binding protein